MTSSIPQTTPPSAYERFVVTPVSKVVRLAIAVFKFIAAMVTWPFKAIYRLFVPSEPKPKEAASPAAAPAAPVRADDTSLDDEIGSAIQKLFTIPPFEVEPYHEGVQDFSSDFKEYIEGELSQRPLVEKKEREQIEKDLVRCTKMTTFNGLETHEYGPRDSQEFLKFLDASSSNHSSQRSLLYFYLSQSPLNLFFGKIGIPLMEEKNLFLCMPDTDDKDMYYRVESSDDELKTENTCTMCLRKLEDGVPGEIFKDCVVSLKATINKTTHAVELKATIELKNPAGKVEKTLHSHNNIESDDSEDDEPVAPIITPAPSDTQNSATAKKAKADVYRPVATEFLKNIIDRAVAQLSKGGRLKLFLIILANVKINRRGEDLMRQIH
jgi:hypothetical protein